MQWFSLCVQQMSVIVCLCFVLMVLSPWTDNNKIGAVSVHNGFRSWSQVCNEDLNF